MTELMIFLSRCWIRRIKAVDGRPLSACFDGGGELYVSDGPGMQVTFLAKQHAASLPFMALGRLFRHGGGGLAQTGELLSAGGAEMALGCGAGRSLSHVP
jgi:hypothetical protein